jgi:Zn-dependent peptidase ImmA (M78 family)
LLPPVLAANRLLDKLGIVDARDLQLLELIAHERDAIVVEEPLVGAEARLLVVGSNAIITISTTVENTQRRRFSIAHELGHLELHRGLGLLNLCDSGDIDNWKRYKSQENREADANEFAAALLLPDRFFGSLCQDEDPSLDLITQLARQFDVSVTATAIRYTQFCHEPVAVVFSHREEVKWFRASSGFEDLRLFVEIGKSVDPSTKAFLFFDGREITSTPKTVRATAWLSPGNYHRDTALQEYSIAMPKYQAVLTLLWLDEELDDDQDDW